MTYTIHELAKLAGVTVRTLHYYDEAGLLKPSSIRENGYRQYGKKELGILQQILFFRELEFPLAKIRSVMESPDYDEITVLSVQKKLLEEKRGKTDRLIALITDTIESLKGGETMRDDTKFSAFNDPTYQKHKDEAEKRWGNTDAYKQSQERVGKLTKEEWIKIKAEGEVITQSIAGMFSAGKPAGSADVQEQIDRFYRHLHHFYDPGYEMFKGLGQMYVDDPRFTEHYEKRVKGLAVFMRDAMAVYADARLK
jgi:DNA-binding transcriptional MerR regulator